VVIRRFNESLPHFLQMLEAGLGRRRLTRENQFRILDFSGTGGSMHLSVKTLRNHVERLEGFV
jgi:hypothetical protein